MGTVIGLLGIFIASDHLSRWIPGLFYSPPHLAYISPAVTPLAEGDALLPLPVPVVDREDLVLVLVPALDLDSTLLYVLHCTGPY